MRRLRFGDWIQYGPDGQLYATGYTEAGDNFVEKIDENLEKNTLVVIKTSKDRIICKLNELKAKTNQIDASDDDYVREVFVARVQP